ncbi:Y-family DNA polymerase [Mycoplasmopsis columboralis]|uniref:DNA polymerase IV n=1 Tax=Mycoplasmopsis columboralis TaxID=171282 RepID=A0A449B5X9_9BACT|nr:DNA polymerase IV [Mycoplasmopsis columboralis]VEU75986.1 DNA polymerase IV [Mycoplasmopsis columboralis]
MQKSFIFHIDFDSYFVSALRSVRPELKGKPVAVGKSGAEFMATSVSYELREKGVKAGMVNFEIQKIEPQTIFVEGHFDIFTTISTNIFKYLSNNYSSLINVASIDECYLDVTDVVSSFDQAQKLAQKIQNEILELFDIPITIGISYNCFFAKMTTNISKPFGIGVTTPQNYQKHFFDLDIEQYYGIGKASAAKLRQIGIEKIKDLVSSKVNYYQLKSIFGIVYRQWIENLNPNHYDRIVVENTLPKGIGNEITFIEKNLSEFQILSELNSVCKLVSTRCRKQKLVGNTLTLVVRNINKKWQSKQMKLPQFTNEFSKIYAYAKHLYQKHFSDRDIIGIGIRINNLIYEFEQEISFNLFEINKDINSSRLNQIVTHVNRKLHKPVISTLKEYNELKNLENKNNKFDLEGFTFKKR